MKKTTKHILSFALVLGVMSVPFLAGAQFNSEAGAGGTGLSTDSLTDTLTNILNIFLGLVALLAVLGMVIAGFMFITAGGNDDRLKSAKSWLTWSIVGVAVALMGYIVINFVATLFQTT